MSEKTSNKKVIWYILFAIFTVVLCYLFVVVFFFYIFPYNISLKLALWPFASTKTAGKLYQDATVHIEFSQTDEATFELVDRSIIGVNIDKQGYVVAPLSLVENAEAEYKILTKQGDVYKGNLIFREKNYNLAIFKCERLTETDKPIKLAYAKLSSNSFVFNKQTVVISEDNEIYGGYVSESEQTIAKKGTFNAKTGLKYILEDCFSMWLENESAMLSQGAVFDEKGNLLGFSYEEPLDDGSYGVITASPAKNFMGNVKRAYEEDAGYENSVIKNLVGFDKTELTYYILASNLNENPENRQYFYLNGQWEQYTEEVKQYNQQTAIEGYYLFKDFLLNEELILAENSIIVGVRKGDSYLEIHDKMDLFKACYALTEGQEVTICYHQGLEGELLTKSFVV